MEIMMDTSEAVLENLTCRGWRFRHPDEMICFIQSKNPYSTALSSSLFVDAIETELLNLDLRSFGGKSLPEPSPAKKSSYLHGPKVLQLVSVRDISQSAIDSSFTSLQHQHHLLRFLLTDGLSETVAIEYTPIPRIKEDIIPGCKVRLENKIAIHYGIICLNDGDIMIMGGLVQSLFDEWQMNRRYSVFSRSSMMPSRNEDGDGPPPFEKIQTEAHPRKVAEFSSSHDQSEVRRSTAADDPKFVSSAMKSEEKNSSMESRPKVVIEAVPVQNQAAAQKLLQKMSQPIQQGRKAREHKARFRGKQEEAPIFTLDEWERRKASTSNAVGATDVGGISSDEMLARQLQSQLDMEDFQKHQGNSEGEAERIRMSMFSFGGTEERRNEGRGDSRVTGRGRGRGRKRFG